MNVLLIADPPGGDKVAAELQKRGIDVDYRRGAKSSMVGAILPGQDWVLVMNGNGHGAALKEAARRVGARYCSIPVGWAQTERVLRENHFPLPDPAPTLTEPTLTHQPLAELVVAPLPEEKPEPTKPAPQPPPAETEISRLAREAFMRDPELHGSAFIRGLRMAGTQVGVEASSEVFRIRREVRAAHGLQPSGATFSRRAPPRRPEPRVPARAVSAPAAGLPSEVMTAAELLAQAVRTAGLVGWVRVSDAGEVDYDAEARVVQKLAGKARVEVSA